MPYPHIDKDRNNHKIDPKAQKYYVRFKPKNQRIQKKDDKLEVVKSTLRLGDFENVFNPATDIRNDTQRQQAHKNELTMTDINRYDLPVVIMKLTEEQYNQLRRHPDVLVIEPAGRVVPKMPQFPVRSFQLWGVNRVGTEEAWNVSQDAGLNKRGDGVYTAVIDTGIDASHEDLDVFRSLSFSDNAPGVPVGSHGSGCAGIICGKDNSVGVVGIAPNAVLYDLMMFGQTDNSFANMIEALVYAETQRMQVINLSVGPADGIANPFTVERDAIAINTNRHGCAVICAAGNEMLNFQSPYPAPGTYPGMYPESIMVSATRRDDDLASYSNFGVPLHIAAPGGDFPVESEAMMSCAINGYDWFLGTSAATPHVAGCCALAMSNVRWNDCNPVYKLGGGEPAFNRGEMLRQVMRETADKMGKFTDKSNIYGYGIIQVDKMLEKMLLGPPFEASVASVKGTGRRVED